MHTEDAIYFLTRRVPADAQRERVGEISSETGQVSDVSIVDARL